MFLLHASVHGAQASAEEEWPVSVPQLAGAFLPGNTSDPLILFTQVALILPRTRLSFGLSHQNLYGMKELPLTAAAACYQRRQIVVAMGISSFGFSLYRHQTAAFGLAYSTRNHFTFGLNLAIHQLQIQRYGETSASVVNIGWRYQWKPGGFVYGNWQNPGEAKIGKSKSRWSELLQVGLVYPIAPRLSILVGCVKTLQHPLERRFATAFQFHPSLMIRAGFTQAPNRFTAGFDLHLRGVHILYGCVFHPVLGYTHSFGIELQK